MYAAEGQEMMDWSTSTMVGRSMGIDVAWGDTSKIAIVITQYRNRKVEVFYAESFEKPLMNEIINHIMQLKQRHHCTKLYCDGANPEVIRELKSRIGEYHDYYGRLTEEQILHKLHPVHPNHWSIPVDPVRFDEFSLYLIWVYNRSRKDRYYTFCTPEAARAIDEYLEHRKSFGEELKDKSPLIRDKFNIDNPFTTKAPQFLSMRTLSFIFEDAIKKASLPSATAGLC